MNEFERLKRDAIKAVDQVAAAPRVPTVIFSDASPEPPKLMNPTAGQIICPNPNCSYIGKPTKTPRGSIAVGIILCLFFLIPGIFYFMLKSGYRNSCPACGMQISVDN